jgi:hypothetical protein
MCGERQRPNETVLGVFGNPVAAPSLKQQLLQLVGSAL